jgi:hypothetical protein
MEELLMAHPKKEKTVMTRIRVSDRDQVKRLADDDGISISDMLSVIINQWIKDQAKKYDQLFRA